MNPVVFYLLITLLQKDGVVATAYGDKADCEAAIVETTKDTDALAISGCLEVALKPLGDRT